MHHVLSCNINCPVANQASPMSTKHRLLRFKELPSVIFYCFRDEYSEMATVSSFRTGLLLAEINNSSVQVFKLISGSQEERFGPLNCMQNLIKILYCSGINAKSCKMSGCRQTCRYSRHRLVILCLLESSHGLQMYFSSE